MEELRLQLSKFATEIQQSITANRPTPLQEPYYTYDWEKFEYSAAGIDLGQGKGRQLAKPNWLKAIHHLSQRWFSDPIFIQTTQMLPQFSTNSNDREYTLKQFVSQAIEMHLTSTLQDVGHRIDQLIKTYIRQIQHQTVQVHAAVFLTGITLQSDSIKLTPDISLRRTTLQDIAFPEPILDFSTIPDSRPPTAILDIITTLQKDDFAKFHQDIDHYVNILNLFGIGPIRTKISICITDSLLPGIYRQTKKTSPHPAAAFRPFHLNSTKEEKLKAFFGYMQQHMPDLSGTNRKIDHLAASFDRYNDACIESRIFERNVMYAVMGLEALYLNDKAELSNKLRMRCSKALSFCGVDPIEVYETLGAGYEIRSTFAHGNHVSKKDQKKYTTKFGNPEKITNRLCNYLRLSICATIILNLKKDSFINSLDYAMLTDSHAQQLRNQFSPLHQYID